MNITQIAEYDHDDENGYYYVSGEDIIKDEEILSRYTLFDSGIPKPGEIHNFLIFSINSKKIFIFYHSDSKKKEGGDTRPASHIQLCQIDLDEEELNYDNQHLYNLLWHNIIHKESNITFPYLEKPVKILTSVLLKLYDIIPDYVRNSFYIRLWNDNEFDEIVKNNAVKYYDLNNDTVVIKSDISQDDKALLNIYTNELQNNNISIKHIENILKYQGCHNYYDFLTSFLEIDNNSTDDDDIKSPQEQIHTVLTALTQTLEECKNIKDFQKKFEIIYQFSNKIFSDEIINIFIILKKAMENTNSVIFIRWILNSLIYSDKEISLEAKSVSELDKYYKLLHKIHQEKLLSNTVFFNDKDNKVNLYYNQIINTLENKKRTKFF